MTKEKLQITILGLSITSSWGNGHATTYRALIRELNRAGHKITFFEKNAPWYAANRDMASPEFCTTILYNDLKELEQNYGAQICDADLVIVGSYTPQGVEAGDLVFRLAKGVTAFYDIDTPVTLAKMDKEDFEYLHPLQIPQYNIYLSFTGGPILKLLEKCYASPMARALYCSVDPELYYPERQQKKWDLGYLGTYSVDRQKPLEDLMIHAAGKLTDQRFVVAGPQYPDDITWGVNVERIEHLAPADHRSFYNQQRFTQNITRTDMIKSGYAPSVRLFEAAACGTPVISDYWDGLESFFKPGKEILISHSCVDTVRYLTEINEEERIAIGTNARKKVLEYHTAAHRAIELINYYNEAVCKISLQPEEMKN
jgi:spore maturation protein CgeB